MSATFPPLTVYVVESMFVPASRLFCSLGPTLAALLLVCATVELGSARAESALGALGAGKVTEISHELKLDLGAHVYAATETLVFANQGKSDTVEAIYTFSLPSQASVVDLSVETADGQESRYAVMGADASTRLVADAANAHKADMGLLRMVASEGSGPSDFAQYELRLFPILKGRTTSVRIRWHGAVHLVSGSATIRLPNRGQAANLARTEVILGTTIALRGLYGGQTLLSERTKPGQSHRFFAPTQGDLVIQGRPQSRAGGARAEVALLPLTANTGVAAVYLTLPGAENATSAALAVVPAVDRALFIVDTSASMQQEGRAAAATLMDGLLGQLGGNTRVETVLYDREAKAVFGKFREATRDVRTELLQGVRGAKAGSGSNIASALNKASKLLQDDSTSDISKTLIVIISDGMTPTTLSGNQAADMLGDDVLKSAHVLTAILVPSQAPLPDVHQSALGEMMQRAHGRIVALRHGEATQAGTKLLGALSQPLPFRALEVELSTGDWVGTGLSGTLLPGSSITAFGFYKGSPPRRVVVSGLRGGVRETIIAKKLRPRETRALAAIAIANARPFGMPGNDMTAEQSLDSLRQAAAKLGVVTQSSAAIAVDRTDGYAADRIRLAQRWGIQTYRRVPPPQEKAAARHKFASFQMRRRGGVVRRGRTGFIDEEMIARRVKAHVIPTVRRCYEKLLRRSRTASGALTLHIEMARGEVLHAYVPHLPASLEPIRSCMEDAMYAMPVPKVRQGQAAEVVTIAKYPLRFRKVRESETGEVQVTKPGVHEHQDGPLIGLPD